MQGAGEYVQARASSPARSWVAACAEKYAKVVTCVDWGHEYLPPQRVNVVCSVRCGTGLRVLVKHAAIAQLNDNRCPPTPPSPVPTLGAFSCPLTYSFPTAAASAAVY